MQKQRHIDKKLLELLARGDTQAFTHLFDLYRGRIFTVALRFLKSRALAEEVVQEVFLKLWTRREQLVRILNFESYLFTMARHQVFDSLKDLAEETRAKKEFAHHIHHASTADDLVIEKQYEEIIDKVVNRLPPQQKRIYCLAKMQGMSQRAIAEQLHISRLTVKAHMAKALHTIRQNLQHHITTFSLLPVMLRIFKELF
jgi:RNA polymerase sigma-70 factor (family 1)